MFFSFSYKLCGVVRINVIDIFWFLFDCYFVVCVCVLEKVRDLLADNSLFNFLYEVVVFFSWLFFLLRFCFKTLLPILPKVINFLLDCSIQLIIQCDGKVKIYQTEKKTLPNNFRMNGVVIYSIDHPKRLDLWVLEKLKEILNLR